MQLQSLILTVMGIILTSMTSIHSQSEELTFVIEHSSQLEIEGSSNVNTFTCHCFCFNEEVRHIQLGGKSGTTLTKFSGSELQIRTKDLDCGKKAMNRDLYEALKEDQYPHIHIRLINTKLFGQLPLTTEWQNFLATTAITIADQEKLVKMHVQGKKLSDNRYRFKGSQVLRMTDFGLEPPKPFMGLIKVDDQIRIHLDLNIRLITETSAD